MAETKAPGALRTKSARRTRAVKSCARGRKALRRSLASSKGLSRYSLWGRKGKARKAADESRKSRKSHKRDSSPVPQAVVLSKASFEERYCVTCAPSRALVRRSDVAYYCGERRQDGEQVAVGMHRVSKEEGIPRGAMQEIALLRGMRHPNILQLLDACCDAESAHVAFSHPGSILPAYLEARHGSNRGCSSAEEIRALLTQVLLGVDFCHSRGVVLSNLKPQNIFVDARTNPPALRLGGLSSAQSLPSEPRRVILRTSWYSPPELLMGYTGMLCFEGDMWTVGCVLGVLVMGRSLFPGDSDFYTLMLIFRQLGTPTEGSWPGVSQLPDFSHRFPTWTGAPWNEHIQRMLGGGGVSLLTDMLALDPRGRPSARRALRHPWLCSPGDCSPGAIEEFRRASDLPCPLKACSKGPFLQDADALVTVESFLGQSLAPQMAEYESAIYSNARSQEVVVAPRADFWLGNDGSLEDGLRCRAILVDWMASVCSAYKKKGSTLFASVAILDQYLSVKQAARGQFQCIGCAAMLIATKSQDEVPLSPGDLVHVSDNAFTLDELRELEADVLARTGFNLTTPTAPYFLSLFCKANSSSPVEQSLASYLSELALLRVQEFPYPASHIAAAAVALSNRLMKRSEVWPQSMAARTGYADEGPGTSRSPSLAECVGRLRKLLKEIKESSLQGMWKRHAATLAGISFSEE